MTQFSDLIDRIDRTVEVAHPPYKTLMDELRAYAFPDRTADDSSTIPIKREHLQRLLYIRRSFEPEFNREQERLLDEVRNKLRVQFEDKWGYP